MRQALLAAALAGGTSLLVLSILAYLVHKLRHSRAPFWWGVIVASILVAAYAYFNYLGR